MIKTIFLSAVNKKIARAKKIVEDIGNSLDELEKILPGSQEVILAEISKIICNSREHHSTDTDLSTLGDTSKEGYMLEAQTDESEQSKIDNITSKKVKKSGQTKKSWPIRKLKYVPDILRLFQQDNEMITAQIHSKLEELEAEKRPANKGVLYTLISEMVHKFGLLERIPGTGSRGPLRLTEEGKRERNQLLEKG